MFTTRPGFPRDYPLPAFLRPFIKAYGVMFVGMVGALFYWFFAVSPARSPIDRRLPWLKWVLVALAVCFIIPEFGEERFVNELLSARTTPVDEMLTAILASVQAFSAGAQCDDLTLLLARVPGPD